MKILGKSGLCFVGLVIVSWLLIQFSDLIKTHTFFTTMLYGTILEFTFWFLLTIAYTYILFRLFISETYCYLIITLNGLFILVLYYILYFLEVDFSIISYLDVRMVQVDSISVIALALMYKYLSRKRIAPKKAYRRTAYVLLILIKSAACMCLFVVLALAGYAFMDLKILDFMPLQNFSFVDLLAVIVYASVLYMLLGRHKHVFWIIAANSAFLLVLWNLILLGIFNDLMSLSFLCLNTALIAPILALIFRSVEKLGNKNEILYRVENSSTYPLS